MSTAEARGHTARTQMSSSAYDLDLFHSPDADLDGRFEATCADTGDLLQVAGWLFTTEG